MVELLHQREGVGGTPTPAGEAEPCAGREYNPYPKGGSLVELLHSTQFAPEYETAPFRAGVVILSANTMLSWADINTMPKNKISMDSLFFTDTLPAISNTYPINRLKQAHSTFTNGDDGPLPGGVANGEGN